MNTHLKILIVEDEAIIAMDLKETLEAAGYIVTDLASSQAAAVNSAARNPPDLALLDIHLKNFRNEGISTARELVKSYNIPIIFLTGNSEIGTFEAAKSTFPAAYLLKPFREDELIFQIEMAIHNFHSRSSVYSGAKEPPYLYLPVDKGYEKVIFDEVLYLKADGSYVKIYLLGKEHPFHLSANLAHAAQYFSFPNFYRVSRSLLINLNHIERLEQNLIFLTGGKLSVSLPTSSKKELMNQIKIVKTK
ncbi:response regulator [Dyadobacter sp. CY261]|uniref:response regulator n=1 Tax=Dyadobacter sp. CY261 TaxID=2907203 RepID=UPI001F2F8A44|nr:response regulator [Dyadobacter sp. CY261]MCF0075583.1 response regulator [Dyadobacter sp. CY261]